MDYDKGRGCWPFAFKNHYFKYQFSLGGGDYCVSYFSIMICNYTQMKMKYLERDFRFHLFPSVGHPSRDIQLHFLQFGEKQ